MLVSDVWIAVCFLVPFGGIIGGMDVAMNATFVVVEKAHGCAMRSTSHGGWCLAGFAGGSLGGLGIHIFGARQHAIIVAVVAAVVIGLAFGLSGPEASGFAMVCPKCLVISYDL